ncbi:MAG: asparagine synthase (glutamine-hydrolyzing) [Gemmatimonadota bacterium]|nr:asparagine synthase (glutamine-hydrolyzing) [Gemmatimonadota bacterium]
MCGIYGMVSLTGAPLRRPDLIGEMGSRLTHRGPDGSRVLQNDTAAIGVERLRIIDPRPNADQPFASRNNSIWLAGNGEIYNYRSIRNRLSGYPFQSKSDIETVMGLIERCGIQSLDQIDGMFALAIWDNTVQTLHLARDRTGEKPLFYSDKNGEVWFASEVQALLVNPEISKEIDEHALNEYLALGYVREPRTMFNEIRKIPAGTVGIFNPTQKASLRGIGIGTWLDMPPLSQPSDTRLKGIITGAVSKQLTADVPVGVFLSGGVDSSLITAIAARQSAKALHTFSAAFTDSNFDESRWAVKASKAFGTVHHELSIGLEDLTTAFHSVSQALAEPLADPALLPTLLLSGEAKRHVGVVLSGEGADELFGGYPTYIGHGLFQSAETGATQLARLLEYISPWLPGNDKPVGLKMLAERFSTASPDPTTRHVNWFNPGIFGLLGHDIQLAVLDDLPTTGERDPIRHAMALDFATYLRDGLLVKLDRASMLASLETRAPYLDPAVVAAAGRLAGRELVSGLKTKTALKRIARDLVPKEITRRPKRGFSVPVGDLMTGPLGKETDQLLSDDWVRSVGALKNVPVARWITEQKNGDRSHSRALWSLLMLRTWFKHWGEGT